ncbi:MAG: DMT family transporter [Planctomycetota bacterium]|jgi:drug/metabolite transporter (DMT)-like permease
MSGTASHKSQHLIGAFAALGSIVFFVATNLITRYMRLFPGEPGNPVPSEEKVFWRTVIGVVAILLMARFRLVRWRFGNIPLLALRGALGAVAVLLYFYSIDHSTVARASFLLFTYPAWGALFSYFFLKEPLGWKRLPAVIVIYTGAFLILRGSAAGGASTLRGDIAGVLCGLTSGAAITTIRALHKYDSTWIIMFFFVFCGAVGGGLVLASKGSYVAPSGVEWVALGGIGLSSLVAHALFTTSFRYLDVTTVGALAMLQAPLSAIAAFALLGEHLGAHTIVGGALVLVGGIDLARTSRARTMERRPHPAPAP